MLGRATHFPSERRGFVPRPPPTASDTRRRPSAVSTHAGSSQQEKVAWSKVTPPPRAALILWQTNVEDEQPCRSSWLRASLKSLPSSMAHCGLSLFRCRDDSICSSAQSCSLPKWSSKDCSLKNALRASQSQSLLSGNSTGDRKVQIKNTLRYNLLTYQIGHKAKRVTPRCVGNIRERSTPTLLVGNVVLPYKITYALTFGPSKSGNLSQRYITLADIWKNTCPKIYWSTTL